MTDLSERPAASLVARVPPWILRPWILAAVNVAGLVVGWWVGADQSCRSVADYKFLLIAALIAIDIVAVLSIALVIVWCARKRALGWNWVLIGFAATVVTLFALFTMVYAGTSEAIYFTGSALCHG